MKLISAGEDLYTNNTSGVGFGVKMGAKLFSVLTESLYKDRAKAVCRETIANCVDAHRMRDSLFAELTPNDQGWRDLVEGHFAEPGTRYNIHLPTAVEPWLEFEDFGVGLSVEKVLGEVQYSIDPQNPSGAPTIARDGNGHPIRSGGAYTTLFGSDKEDDNSAIGAYGLGCKSPYAIVDTFLVKSRLGGYEHQYLMILNSDREPQVDWLTKDPVTGEPAPVKTDKKNGLCVRLDSIPVSMKKKIEISVADILQNFEGVDQPIVNNGLFEYAPVVYEDEDLAPSVKIVKTFDYGTTFTYEFAVNLGGIIYPLDTAKLREHVKPSDVDMLTRYAKQCIVIFMELGTVNVPPSREEISYDDITMSNIVTKLKCAIETLEKMKSEIVDSLELTMVSLGRVRSRLSRLDPENYGTIIRDRWDLKVKELRDSGRDSGVALAFRNGVFRCFVECKHPYNDFKVNHDFRVYRDTHNGLTAAYQDEFVLNASESRRIAGLDFDGFLLNVSSITDKQGLIVLNDTHFSRNTILTRLKKLSTDAVLEMVEGLVDVGAGRELPKIVIFVGSSNSVQRHTFEEYVQFTEHLCRRGGFNYILGSEICDKLKDAKNQVVGITKSEIDRNMSECVFHPRAITFTTVTPDIFEDGDDMSFILQDEHSEFTMLMSHPLMKEAATERGILNERVLMVRGKATASRKAIEAASNFYRVDLAALRELNYEIRLEYVHSKIMRESADPELVRLVGLKTVASALAFSIVIHNSSSRFNSLIEYLDWVQLFVNRHPELSFKENDKAFRKFGPHGLGDLYGRLVLFSKILGRPKSRRGSTIPKMRLSPAKLMGDIRSIRLGHRKLEDNRFGLMEQFGSLGITPWKSDMEILTQLNDILSQENEFSGFHGGVFPTPKLTDGLIDMSSELNSDLNQLMKGVYYRLRSVTRKRYGEFGGEAEETLTNRLETLRHQIDRSLQTVSFDNIEKLRLENISRFYVR